METAAVEALQALVLGKTIEVRFAGERNDRYGRIKGHAFIRTDDGAGWVQGRLLLRRAWPAPIRWPHIVPALPSSWPPSARRARRGSVPVGRGRL